MNEIELKKEKLKSLLKGRPAKPLSVEEAKKRLIQTDPGIDIGKIVKVLNTPSDNKLKLLAIEILSDPELIAYFSPIIKALLIRLLPRR